MKLNYLFYLLKPIIPRRLQLFLRRMVIRHKLKKCRAVWPINPVAAARPKHWSGWPEEKKFALILTHDVENMAGTFKTLGVMRLEAEMGFRSSFNFVPERYPTPDFLRRYLIENGFEVGVHGLNHDGKLFLSRQVFQQRALRINHYLYQWNAVGFRAPAMHHNLEWQRDLEIEYDASTFDTDPFEPQSDGVNTIFPFFVHGKDPSGGYVELPYTLPQDFTLFILMRHKNISLLKQKLDWIVENGGMALINTHPDYMGFNDSHESEEYPVQYYHDFLEYVKLRYEGQYWNPLPKDLARYYKATMLKTSVFQEVVSR